jgi:hypothetical protein
VKKSVAVFSLTALAALVPALVLAAATVPYLPIPKGAAVILNTGSTNALGYRIVVQSSGVAEYVAGNARAKARVSAATANKFFADMRAGARLAQMPIMQCMKSASFGTSTFVWWRGQRSGDLECAADARGKALASDVSAIAQALKIETHAKRMLPTNEPRRPLPEPTPTATATH